VGGTNTQLSINSDFLKPPIPHVKIWGPSNVTRAWYCKEQKSFIQLSSRVIFRFMSQAEDCGVMPEAAFNNFYSLWQFSKKIVILKE